MASCITECCGNRSQAADVPTTGAVAEARKDSLAIPSSDGGVSVYWAEMVSPVADEGEAFINAVKSSGTQLVCSGVFQV